MPKKDTFYTKSAESICFQHLFPYFAIFLFEEQLCEFVKATTPSVELVCCAW